MPQPVLILGAEPRIGATIARSLHRRGISVDVAALSSQEHPLSSRAVRRFMRLPDHRSTPDEFFETLTKLIRTEQFDMLIPTSDTALTVVAQYYQDLSTLLHVGCPPPYIVNKVLDKCATIEVARACGIGIPVSYLVADLAELERLDDSLRFPMIGKPRSKTDLNPFKTRYFRRFEELRDAFLTDTNFGRKVLLQQYCSGEGVGIAVLMQKGYPIAMFQHRRLKELPSTGGVSVMAVAERLDQRLAEQAVTVLRALEWDGVAMVEFKQDHTTGRTALMEVNGRYWGTVSLAVQAGMDFPFYEWQLVHGERPHVPPSYQPGVRWRWTSGDVLRLHDVFAQSKSNGFSLRLKCKELVRFVKDLFTPTHDALWSKADPGPGLSELARTLKALAVQDLKTAIKGLFPPRILSHVRTYRNLSLPDRSAYAKLQLLRTMALRRDDLRRMRTEIRSVLFVCHGNIIRSPMSAALLSESVSGGDHDAISIRSAGVHANLGNSADRRALTVAREFEISLDDHRAQPLTPELVNWADVIFVMDFILEAKVVGRFPEAKGKTFLLGGLGRRMSSEEVEIQDPNAGDENDIRRCYNTLQLRIRELTNLLFLHNRTKDPWREAYVSAGRTVDMMR